MRLPTWQARHPRIAGYHRGLRRSDTRVLPGATPSACWACPKTARKGTLVTPADSLPNQDVLPLRTGITQCFGYDGAYCRKIRWRHQDPRQCGGRTEYIGVHRSSSITCLIQSFVTVSSLATIAPCPSTLPAKLGRTYGRYTTQPAHSGSSPRDATPCPA